MERLANGDWTGRTALQNSAPKMKDDVCVCYGNTGCSNTLLGIVCSEYNRYARLVLQ